MITLALWLTFQQSNFNPASLIQCQEGELPIILTAPHGGKLPIAGVPERSKIDTPQFATVEDIRTNLLAERTAVQIEKDTGKKVFIVIAKFARKYADANRPVEYGTECDAAAKVHQEYHKTLKSYVDKVTKNFPQALLIDIHGQGSDKAVVYRGTQNRKTVTGFPEVQITGPSSLLGKLESSGIKLVPETKDSVAKETTKFTGGYIVQTYGAKNQPKIMAIQLEWGSNYRQTSTLDETADKLAKAIESHYFAYLAHQLLQAPHHFHLAR